MRRSRSEFVLLEIENMDIRDIDSGNYQLKERISKAIQQLEVYSDILSEKIDANFESDVWVFRNLMSYSAHYFDFNAISHSIKFNRKLEKENFILITKCWMALGLSEKSLITSSRMFSNLISAVYITNGFDSKHTDKLIKLLKQSTFYRLNNKNEFELKIFKSHVLHRIIFDIVNFLTFFDQEKFKVLIGKLERLKSKIKIKREYKKLPSFKDVLKVKIFLDTWFNEAIIKGKEELLRFYPLVIWWRLTNIIPMRPTEFCKIKKDCLNSDNEKYYITFPRLKYHHKDENRIRIHYDTLPIPKELYDIIDDYRSISSTSRKSEYLIDYNTYSIYTLKNHYYKVEIPDFDSNNLSYMFWNFYKEIIVMRYHVELRSIHGTYKSFKKNSNNNLPENLPKDKMQSTISVGDLRHLAIINLMMQGYDKVEIQRLAGHITEETQYSYYNHMENWTEIEIKKMERQFRLLTPIDTSVDDNTSLGYYHPKVYEFFEDKNKQLFLNPVKQEDFKKFIKLKIGYCTDKSMPCPTFNWGHSGCYFCKHWTISYDELQEKRDLIAKDLYHVYDELKNKVNFMKYLFEAQLDEFGNVDRNTKKDLSTTANEVQLGITKVAKLRVMLGIDLDE